MAEKVTLPMTAEEIESITDLKTAKIMLKLQAAMINELTRRIAGLQADVEEMAPRKGHFQAPREASGESIFKRTT